MLGACRSHRICHPLCRATPSARTCRRCSRARGSRLPAGRDQWLRAMSRSSSSLLGKASVRTSTAEPRPCPAGSRRRPRPSRTPSVLLFLLISKAAPAEAADVIAPPAGSPRMHSSSGPMRPPSRMGLSERLALSDSRRREMAWPVASRRSRQGSGELAQMDHPPLATLLDKDA